MSALPARSGRVTLPRPATDVGRCDICSQLEEGRSWHLRYQRKGTTSGDLRKSFDTGERPASSKELGARDFFVGSRCESRLFWRERVGLRDNRVSTWVLALLGIAFLAFYLRGGAPGWYLMMLALPMISAIAVRHDPVSIRRRIFLWVRPQLAEEHAVPLRLLELIEPTVPERLAAYLDRSRGATG